MEYYAQQSSQSNELEALKSTYHQFKDRIQNSRWAQYVIESL